MERENDFLLWSHTFWNFIHVSAAFATTPTMRNAYKELMSEKIMFHLIPCKSPCSTNFLRHLQELQIDRYMRSNIELLEWSLKLHNLVNEESGKHILTEQELQKVRENYLPSLQVDKCLTCSDPSEDPYRNGTYKIPIHSDKINIKPSFIRR